MSANTIIRRSREGLLAGIAVGGVLLGLTACAAGDPGQGETNSLPGGSPASSQSATSDRSSNETAVPGTDSDPSTVLGTATIGDTRYEFTQVILCEPFDDGSTVQRDLEVIALAPTATGGQAQLDVSHAVYSGIAGVQLDWFGPEGLFSAVEDFSSEVLNGRVIGSGTMESEDSDTVLAVNFELALPTEETACR